MEISTALCWGFLALAILAEVTGTSFLKSVADSPSVIRGVGAALCYAASLAALTMALKRLEVGTAYAVWSGCGTMLIAVLGMVAFGESASWPKLLSLALVVSGVAGLQLSNR
jgi:small multidrug resistance pump